MGDLARGLAVSIVPTQRTSAGGGGGFGETGKGVVGGVWAGGPAPGPSPSLVFLARGRGPESGVRALLPPVVVVVAPLGLELRLGLIALWTVPGVLLPLGLSRFASLWDGVRPAGVPPPFTCLVILVLGSLALAVLGPVAPCEKAVTYSPSASDLEEV